MKSKVAVVRFLGTNFDRDVWSALEQIGAEPQWWWHEDLYSEEVDAVIIPGGFSYGDYLRSGAIARFSPIMQEVLEFADKGGFVFGICNGFQILTEAHLLPGALLQNNIHQFICKNVRLRAETDESMISSSFTIGETLKVPIAHGEGNFYCDDTTLQQLKENNQILFRYCDENGKINPESNPNGSLESIAGICNKQRNVFGMMPHPERASDILLGNTDGHKIFKSILNTVMA